MVSLLFPSSFLISSLVSLILFRRHNNYQKQSPGGVSSLVSLILFRPHNNYQKQSPGGVSSLVSLILFRPHNNYQKQSPGGVFKSFTIFTENLLCQNFFFRLFNRKCFVKMFLKMLQNSQENIFKSATLLKKRLQRRCFPVNFTKFQEHLFYRTSSG